MLASTLLSLMAVIAPQVATATGSDKWHFDSMVPMFLGRLDPIISPGKVSQHVHRVIGGSNFAANYNYNNSISSECTSIYCPADKSNYWTPQVYWTKEDSCSETNSYTVLASHHRFYYILSRNTPDEPVSAFPEGLQIVIGNPYAKNVSAQGIPDTALTFTCQQTTHYTDPSLDPTSTTWDFDMACPDGMKTELQFPNCWNGISLYESDGSHMAYASSVQYGSCPLSHPIRVPMIMLENTWAIPTDVAPKGHMIFANGDCTGYGMHADFAMGWDTSVLTKALNDPACVGLDYSIAAADCPSLGISEGSGCNYDQRGKLNETGTTEGETVTSLPGCNLPWSSGDKPTCSGNQTEPDLTPFLGVTQQESNVSTVTLPSGISSNLVLINSSSTAGWQQLGCMNKNVIYGQSGSTSYTDHTFMTVEVCEAYCGEQGLPYAGLELGYVCHCSPTFDTSSNAVPTGCGTPCVDDSSEDCGGDGTYMTFYSAEVESNGAQNPMNRTDYVGCYGGKTVDTKNPSGWADIDQCQTKCAGYTYAAVMNGYYCYCSDELVEPTSGYAGLSSDLDCDTPCKTNADQKCGGLYFQSVYLTSGGVFNWTSREPEAASTTTGNSTTEALSNNLVEGGDGSCTSGNVTTVTVTGLAAATQTVLINRKRDDACTTTVTVSPPDETVLVNLEGMTLFQKKKRHDAGKRHWGRRNRG